jgi:D-alanyl-D-alanine-carboxypeptidase/D-alanyl-D-alanine-endopeptidase
MILSTDEIREILAKRVDHQKQATGIAVGLVEPNGRQVIDWGEVDGNSNFEIGSISKIFTSLLLAEMVHHKEVALDDPAARYLPENVRMPGRSGKSITLLDLATHYSGLPSVPGKDDVYPFLSSYTLPRDPGSEFEYSNLGAGLLGHILAIRAGTEYESLIRTRVTQPLSMPDTGINLSSSMRERAAMGHTGTLAPVAAQDLPAHLAGAGALRSTANDMLTFLEAFLGYTESSLTPAMRAMLEVRRPARQIEIGLGWFIFSKDGRQFVTHSGATGGFASFAGYDLKERIGVVVLSNACTPNGVDDIGMHLLNPKSPLASPEPPKQHTEIPIDPGLLDRYAGRYQVTPNLILEITRDGDRLFAQGFAQLPHNPPGDLTALPKFELFAEGEKNFFSKASDSRITFEAGPDSRATSLILQRAGREMPAAPRLP